MTWAPIPSVAAVERAQAADPEHAHGVDPISAFLLFLNLLVVAVAALLLRMNRPGRPTVDWRLEEQRSEGAPDPSALSDYGQEEGGPDSAKNGPPHISDTSDV